MIGPYACGVWEYVEKREPDCTSREAEMGTKGDVLVCLFINRRE